MSSKISRQVIKRFSQKMGIDDVLRKFYVEFNLIGERTRFAFQGRPDPTSVILLAGSGRSGTTWLANLLTSVRGVQQVFEPLWPPSNTDVRRLTGWDMKDPYFREVYLRSDGVYPSWNTLLYKIFTGQYRNYWTDYERTSWFPKRFLVKEIRANLMLGYIYDHFKLRIVYIIRHPCAVISSRLSIPKPWYADVKDILDQEELVEGWLRPWIKDIEREKDLLGAHAVWWAVENMVAITELDSRPYYRVFYEDILIHPYQVGSSIYNWLGKNNLPHEFGQMLQNPSRMSEKTYSNKLQRLSRWKIDLSQEQQNRILSWARRLGLDWYTEKALPVHLQSMEINV